MIYFHFSCIHDIGYKAAVGKLAFIHEIDVVNVNITHEITYNFQSICSSTRNVSTTLPQLLDYMQCINKSIKSTLSSTEFVQLASKLSQQFDQSKRLIEQCVITASGWEANV